MRWWVTIMVKHASIRKVFRTIGQAVRVFAATAVAIFAITLLDQCLFQTSANEAVVNLVGVFSQTSLREAMVDCCKFLAFIFMARLFPGVWASPEG